VIERRHADRVKIGEPIVITIEGREVPALLEDLSEHGALFRVDARGAVSSDDLGLEGVFVLATVTPARRYTGEIIRLFFRDNAAFFAVRFWRGYTEVT
jgi:PilZ domain